jgi:hypothetical protein
LFDLFVNLEGDGDELLSKRWWYYDRLHGVTFQTTVLFIGLILPAALGPGVYSASNRNKHQKQKNNIYGKQRAVGA